MIQESAMLKIPFFCPVCSSPIKNQNAVNCFKKIGACEMCESFIYYINKEKWDNGWRPTQREARIYLRDRGLPLIIEEIDG